MANTLPRLSHETQLFGTCDLPMRTDSSWLGYGNTLDAPADNVTFFNMGLLNSRISALQDRINQLEKEFAEAKAKK